MATIATHLIIWKHYNSHAHKYDIRTVILLQPELGKIPLIRFWEPSCGWRSGNAVAIYIKIRCFFFWRKKKCFNIAFVLLGMCDLCHTTWHLHQTVFYQILKLFTARTIKRKCTRFILWAFKVHTYCFCVVFGFCDNNTNINFKSCVIELPWILSLTF